jgi:hypothetical protein
VTLETSAQECARLPADGRELFQKEGQPKAAVCKLEFETPRKVDYGGLVGTILGTLGGMRDAHPGGMPDYDHAMLHTHMHIEMGAPDAAFMATLSRPSGQKAAAESCSRDVRLVCFMRDAQPSIPSANKHMFAALGHTCPNG